MKITISRIFETTKALATDAGNQLQDFIQFQAQFAEIALRSLRNGLTYADNMDCTIKTIAFQDNTPLTLVLDKKPTEIRIRKVLNSTYSLSKPIKWYFNNQGNPEITLNFTPTPTAPISVEIIILY